MNHAWLFLLLSFPAYAAPPAPSWVVWPTPVTPEPPPTPPPAPPPFPAIATLSQDEVYVIDAKESCFCLASPSGIVSVTQDAGPIRIRGRFVGGSGNPETRTFQGPTVFTIEALNPGRVELIVVKAGAKGPADVERRIIDVLVGPRPPPTPVDALSASVQAAFTADTSPTKAADAALLAGVFRAVAKQISGIKTAEGLFTVMTSARAAQIADRLPAIRKLFGEELAKLLPTDQAAALTPALQTTAAAQLNRFADILGGLR